MSKYIKDPKIKETHPLLVNEKTGAAYTIQMTIKGPDWQTPYGSKFDLDIPFVQKALQDHKQLMIVGQMLAGQFLDLCKMAEKKKKELILD